MSAVYDNWDRLIAAVLRREDDRDIALMSFSDHSTISTSSSSSFDLGSFQYKPVASFTYRQIRQATNGLSSWKLFKRGHSGDLYSGVLRNGIKVVVKKVDVLSWEKKLGLMSEMRICGSLMLNNHRLVPLLGHCSEKADKKFLVYKYMPNKDLSRYLRGGIHIDWTKRLKIATEAAKSLCYLHHECYPPIVHRDVQASSILLDDDFEVRLGSLSGACIEEENNTTKKISKSLQLSISSRSSEQTKDGTSNAVCAMDVYSFGKVLLELVTVAFIAKACLRPNAMKRPKMAKILKALEHVSFTRHYGIAGSRTTSQNHKFLVMSRTVKDYPKGQISPHPNLKTFTFQELIDATRNFEMKSLLGQDEFGKVYQGLLHENSMSQCGTAIAVKSMTLKWGNGFSQWQAEVEMLGRLSHPNILTPVGYCWEGRELLLVFEFMQEGSLDKCLFGKRSAVPLFSWGRRLNILIGAARGLEFLHALERQGVFRQKKLRGGFYGCFKCSKILIDSDYNSRITGFSVAEIDPPRNHLEGVIIRGAVNEYAAPEYKESGNSLLESDVYGFGIVLFQMLTARDVYPSMFKAREVESLTLIKVYIDSMLNSTDLELLEFIENYIDLRLKGKVSSGAVLRIIRLAQLCLREDYKLRPSMQQVVQILESIADISNC